MNAIWKCAKRKCDWTGTDAEKAQIPIKGWLGAFQNVCPKCGSEGFYWTDKIADKKETQ
jgi:hypothetical protein